jgi:hypothetical protein
MACAAALLLAPAIAVAKPGYVISPGSRTVELNLKGSRGYSIHIAEVNDRWTELFASSGRSAALYLIRRHTRGSGIEAEFPGVGRVSMRFAPTGPPRREPGFFSACDGGATIKQPGYFLGLTRLRGERGYTTVHAIRAPGQVITMERETCRRSIFNEQSEPEDDITQLVAYSRSGGRTVAFSGSTVHLTPRSFTSFGGNITERRDQMTIVRYAFASGETSDLAPSDTGPFPLSATVTPPSPFKGSGVFQRVPGGDNSWTGSLRIAVPGVGQVRLAGPSFSARLCRTPGCRRKGSQRLSAFLSRRAARRAFAR